MSEPIYERPAGLTDAEWEVAQREAEAAWQRMKAMSMKIEPSVAPLDRRQTEKGVTDTPPSPRAGHPRAR